MPEPLSADQHLELAAFALQHSAGEVGWVEASGTSMRPLMQAGDRLEVEFGASRPPLGAIVVFPDQGRIVAHRLVARVATAEGELLVTRGDGVSHLDAPFPPERLFGTVRSCRRPPSDRLQPVLEGGRSAQVLARVSSAGGRLVAVAERRGILSDQAGWLAGVSVARLATLLARRSRPRAS